MKKMFVILWFFFSADAFAETQQKFLDNFATLVAELSSLSKKETRCSDPNSMLALFEWSQRYLEILPRLNQINEQIQTEPQEVFTLKEMSQYAEISAELAYALEQIEIECE